ncbi:cytochrome P450 9e2-like isoform X2 [Anthonomus grandis grandis]|nr:cytochrome P450 9e2-like isoform X2 [Anthonomus grandis grandis]
MLRDPELIKQITVKDFDHFTDHRQLVDPEAEPLWSSNLFSLQGQKWREMRATLSGTFTSAKMKYMFGVINEVAENFAQHFLNQDQKLIETEMKETLSRYTNDIIATSAFGIKVDSLKEPDNNFYLMGKRITNLTGVLTLFKFVGYTLVPKLLKKFKATLFDREAATYLKTIIYETIHVREEEQIIRQDMINLLLEVKKGIKKEHNETVDTGFSTAKESDYLDKYKSNKPKQLTDLDIAAQSFIFFFAGFDTVSSALSFGAYELAVNQEIQYKLREEIRKTYKDIEGKLTYEELLKMQYMDMVFSEILRKWPPLVGIDRVCTKPYTIEPELPSEKAYHFKIGDSILLPMHGLHRDPKYFPDPLKFDPERFSEKNRNNIKPYTYLPFGSGPRNCIGSRFAILEAKALLFHLLLHFKLVPTKKTTIPLKAQTRSLNNNAEVIIGLERI